ncbi:MAG TPA: retroviral-like aspartic protease family protein [Allosphingosinicella sp.]|nr:retroviral-like aspartic protease family protein [Allosphingosinicella sp.]
MRRRTSLRLLAGLIATAALAGSGAAQEAAPPRIAAPSPVPTPVQLDQQQAETLNYAREVDERMTVGVSIAGRGPFRFIVDTGAERTVISSELARTLALQPGRLTTVHSMTEVSQIATVVIPQLRVGSRSIAGIHAPALARANLGASGILGVDSLQSQRVTFDFERREMTVTPSRRREESWPDSNTVVVTGRSLYGRLVLVDAAIDGQRVWVIIDTGSEVSVGNSALRAALARRNRLGPMAPIRMVSITGGEVTAQYSIARRIRIGGIDINNLPIAFADVHPFRQLGLEERPALLLGMDALQLFDRVSVDFPNRRVRVLIDDGAMLLAPTRIAGSALWRRSR